MFPFICGWISIDKILKNLFCENIYDALHIDTVHNLSKSIVRGKSLIFHFINSIVKVKFVFLKLRWTNKYHSWITQYLRFESDWKLKKTSLKIRIDLSLICLNITLALINLTLKIWLVILLINIILAHILKSGYLFSTLCSSYASLLLLPSMSPEPAEYIYL